MLYFLSVLAFPGAMQLFKIILNKTNFFLKLLIVVKCQRFFFSLLQNIPDHVLPASFFQLHIPGLFPAESEDGKQSSIITM